MGLCYGNALDFQKYVDLLNTVEDSTMIPLYMKKAKVSEDEIRDKINAESWLGAKQTQEIFNVNLIEEQKQAVACVSDLFKKYKNVPKDLKNIIEGPKEPKFDYSDFEQRLVNIKK